MRKVAGFFAAFLVWNLVSGTFLILLDPWLGLPIALAFTALFVWGYLLRAPAGADPGTSRPALIRAYPIRGDALRWTLFAIPTLLFLSWALGDLYVRIIPVPTDSLNPFEEILSTSGGRLAIAVFAIVVAPITEEFVFRGLIQSHLSRLYGPVIGIASAGALFALVHLLPWVFPLHFFLGVAFGVVVYLTDSIWSGVMLHAANNSAAMLGTLMFGEAESSPTLWEIGPTPELWLNVLLLLVALLAALVTVRGLERSRLASPSTPTDTLPNPS